MRSAVSGIAVTPSDTVNLVFPSGTRTTTYLYVGTSGNIKVMMSDGKDVTINSLAAGVMHKLSVLRVYATGTTATNIVAFF